MAWPWRTGDKTRGAAACEHPDPAAATDSYTVHWHTHHVFHEHMVGEGEHCNAKYSYDGLHDDDDPKTERISNLK